MPSLSIPEIEDRSGMEKQTSETLNEYLRRVGERTDLPSEDIEAVIDHAAHTQFGPEPTTGGDVSTDVPIERFLRAADEIGEREPERSTENDETESDDSEVHIGLGARNNAARSAGSTATSGTTETSDSGTSRRSFVLPVVLVLGVVVLAAGVLFVGGGQLPATDAGPESTDGEPEPSGDDEPDTIDSAADAEGDLEVTDMAVDASLEPDEEFVELTNAGDATLDMSDWTVRDREGGAVDERGIEPVTFPEEFTLEPGESVRIVTGPGEDTADTVHWGSETRNWHEDGDVIVVLDGDGEEVLASEYGSPP
ncbi:lamin tail domain-containing protein [Halalkalicoccus tibetensis]|uniref:Lamin tail domain-containing protein n=1 Tax=Halalkalicoccus tibetensis TaxID=175632 RepID=A0ABD5V500_9EURY